MKRSEAVALMARVGFVPDRFRFRRDGSIRVERDYFYRGDLSISWMIDVVREIVPGAVIVASGDRWAPYPRRSFMFVEFRLPDARRLY